MSGKFGFDTFLTNLPEMPNGSPTSAAPPARPVNPSSSGSYTSGTQQPIDILLGALVKQQAMTIRQMIPLLLPQFGNSIGLVSDAVDKLVTLGYAKRSGGDQVEITADGLDAAQSLTFK